MTTTPRNDGQASRPFVSGLLRSKCDWHSCRKLFATVVVSFGVLSSLNAARFSVVVDDIPRPATIEFPEGFRLADTPEALKRRKRILDFYRLNPAFKGKHNEILFTDWKSPTRVPVVVVGVLGTTSKSQGKISRKDWLSLRDLLLNSGQSQVKEIREKWRPNVETNSPVPVKTTEELVWFEQQTDASSVVVLSHLRQEIDGQLETVLSARKILYHEGFVLFANVVVDASKPDALSKLRQYLASIRIVSI